MRKLKWHEQKLLKKVNLLAWKSEHGRREVEVMRRYHIQDRDDYKKYNKLAGMVSKLCNALRDLPGNDEERQEMTRLLSERLFAMGLVNSATAGIRCGAWRASRPLRGALGEGRRRARTRTLTPRRAAAPVTSSAHRVCESIATSAFCRRRLAVVLVKNKMAETMREAVTFVEQGHVRVGPNTVTEPAHHVTRAMEDFVTWADTSKIKRKVMKYNDKYVVHRRCGGDGDRAPAPIPSRRPTDSALLRSVPNAAPCS